MTPPLSETSDGREQVFEELLAAWWKPIIEELREAGGGQPMHSSLAFYERQRDEWRCRWREATGLDNDTFT